MAIYHLSVKTVSRSTGRSAVGAAAYRCGQRLTNDRDGVVHDYRARLGVEHAEVILPENAPAWMSDRAALWNAAEQAEARKDAKTAREYEVALPHELDAAQRQELAREFGQHVAEKFGVAVDVSIHAPHPKMGDGQEIDVPGGDPRNFHAHILTTTRRLTLEGLGAKTRELDVKQTSADLVEGLRAEWAAMTNLALERAGIEARVDHRSFDRQGLDVTPTPHLGKDSVKAMRDGMSNNRTAAYQEAQQAQIIDLAAVRERRRQQEKANAERKPGRFPRSFDQAAQRAKSEHKSAGDNRNGLRHLPGVSVADGSRDLRQRGPGGLLPSDPRPYMGRRSARDRQAMPRQHESVPLHGCLDRASALQRLLDARRPQPQSQPAPAPIKAAASASPSLTNEPPHRHEVHEVISWGDYNYLRTLEQTLIENYLSASAVAENGIFNSSATELDAGAWAERGRDHYQPLWAEARAQRDDAKRKVGQLQQQMEKLSLTSRLAAKLTGGLFGGAAAETQQQLSQTRERHKRCNERCDKLDRDWTIGGMKEKVAQDLLSKRRGEDYQKQREKERKRDEAKKALSQVKATLAMCQQAAHLGALGGQRSDRTPVFMSLPASAGDDPRAAERAAAQVQAALARKMAEAKARTEKERSLIEDPDDEPEIKRRKARMRPGRRR